MPTLAVAPLVLKDVVLTLATGGDDFRKHVSGVVFTPSNSPQTWQGLGLNSHTDSGIATWTLVLDYVQDWSSPKSLSQYLLSNEGATVAATFKPVSGSGPSFTSNVSITPGAVGGQVNAFATTQVTLGSDRPVLVPGALAADEDTTDESAAV